MIAANEVVAQFLSKEGVESIFRVHETPHPHKVEEFSELVAQFGLKFKPRSLRPIEFQKFIHSISGRSDEEMLAYLMLRSFKQAKYLAVNSGHFPTFLLIFDVICLGIQSKIGFEMKCSTFVLVCIKTCWKDVLLPN